ncbi:hypothetical protein RND81_06G022300 [Saponaria officinalis]|uniref:Reverse transcriptase zinc-binding domain-containing protein n=1 Tax=Saponaria officinalis TaxID=3572 RepID=A0AAW1K5G9_SAPOF
MDGLCPVCSAVEETEVNVIWDCGWARGVWLDGDIEECIEVVRNEVREWVSGVWQFLGENERLEFMMMCWAIWRARNELVFEGADVSPRGVLRRVEGLMVEMEQGRQHV